MNRLLGRSKMLGSAVLGLVLMGLACGSGESVAATGGAAQSQFEIGNTPTQVPDLANVVSLSASGQYMVASTADGHVWTFGDRLLYGVQGNGDTGTTALTPIQVPGLSEVVQVSTTGYTTYALQGNGDVWAWGLNRHGELGNGSRQPSAVPVKVLNLPPITRLIEGRAMALTATGDVWAWGSGSRGLGTGSWKDALTPKRVSLPVKATAVWAGPSRAYAMGRDGRLWGWGTGANGSMGNGTVSFRAAKPITINGVGRVVDMDVTYDAVHALIANGTVISWGVNYYGELGIGSRIEQVTRPVTAKGLRGVVSMNADFGAVVAVSRDGSVYRWGRGAPAGAAFTGDPDFKWVPTRVKGISNAAIAYPHSTPAGVSFYAIDPDGTLVGWGNNTRGILGLPDDSPEVRNPTPIPLGPVAELHPSNSETSGRDDPTTFALLRDGTVWTWGWLPRYGAP